MKKFKFTPIRTLFLSFAAVILIGAILLMLPFSSRTKTVTDPITALFTATSATCVTGLVVVDTYDFWSPIGQLIILLLIQVGGLGYMTIATFVLLGLRRRIALKERAVLKEGLNVPNLKKIVSFSQIVFYVVLIFEGLGAILLFTKFVKIFPLGRAIWASIFHSVSAFCNAGLDVMGNFESLTSFVNNPLINIVIMLLIIIGGIGFIVIREMLEYILNKVNGEMPKKISLHTKIVLRMTVALILTGALFIFVLEYNNPSTLGKLPLSGKILASFFQSVTPRTAGFNTVDIGSMTQPSLILTIVLMFIGGSPGGTAGGIKTTTFTIILFLLFGAFQEDSPVIIAGRRIPSSTIRKSLVIFGLSIFIVFTSTFLILLNQGSEFSLMQVLFEVTSAFGTVGLSTGITPKLSNFSRLVITATMFLGRVGPLTVMMSLSARKKYATPRFPEEDVAVG